MNEDAEYFYVREEALQLLPETMRAHFTELVNNRRDAIQSVDTELNRLGRVSRSLFTLSSLRHIQRQLAAFSFAPTMEAVWQNEALTTAFVITYARLQQGGGGIGFNPKKLPAHLHEQHDRIIELRNERFAHDDPTSKVITSEMEIRIKGDDFEFHSQFDIIIQVGGSPVWEELVDAIESLLIEHQEKLLKRLSQKTSRKWFIARQVISDGEDSDKAM